MYHLGEGFLPFSKHMNIYTFFTLIIVGFICTYTVALAYAKYLRGQTSGKINDLAPILTAIFFGGPILLLTYMITEIRIEDLGHKRRYLIFGIIHTVWQAILVVLLVYFGLVHA